VKLTLPPSVWSYLITPLPLATRTPQHGETTPFLSPGKPFTCLQADYRAPPCLRSRLAERSITVRTRQNFKNPKGPKRASQRAESEINTYLRTRNCSSYSVRTNVFLLISYSIRTRFKSVHTCNRLCLVATSKLVIIIQSVGQKEFTHTDYVRCFSAGC
jgi:hypothetical protein